MVKSLAGYRHHEKQAYCYFFLQISICRKRKQKMKKYVTFFFWIRECAVQLNKSSYKQQNRTFTGAVPPEVFAWTCISVVVPSWPYFNRKGLLRFLSFIQKNLVLSAKPLLSGFYLYNFDKLDSTLLNKASF